MGINSFIIYDSDLKSIDYLTDAQIGKLFRAVKAYRLEGTITDLGKNPALNMLYDNIIDHIDINEKKYNATRQKRSETMKQRWNERKSAIVDYSAQQSTIVNDSPLSDNDIVNDIDNDIVIVNDNEYAALGAKRENKRKNYHGKKKSSPLRGEPSYDIDSFTRKAIGLKYEKKNST